MSPFIFFLLRLMQTDLLVYKPMYQRLFCHALRTAFPLLWGWGATLSTGELKILPSAQSIESNTSSSVYS